jgi:hypothetical protein
VTHKFGFQTAAHITVEEAQIPLKRARHRENTLRARMTGTAPLPSAHEYIFEITALGVVHHLS